MASGDAMKFGEKNVGGADRLVRAIAGAGLMVAITLRYVDLPLSYAAFAAGILLLATAFSSTCPLYTVLGASTCKKAAAGARKKRRRASRQGA